tara:strand:- start:956 stop:1465 length:510 start_codon:yes stop_codon:yes gene_type:complete
MNQDLINQYIALMLQGLPKPEDYSEPEWEEAFNQTYNELGGFNDIYNPELNEMPEAVAQYIPETFFFSTININNEDCNCWANGTDYLIEGWKGNPNCCYGCTNPTDWNYNSAYTCHIEEACKLDPNGLAYPWEGQVPTEVSPVLNIIGCYDIEGEPMGIPGSVTPCPDC